jgi:hypothetical protein
VYEYGLDEESGGSDYDDDGDDCTVHRRASRAPGDMAV